jgi:hypothetical protein
MPRHGADRGGIWNEGLRLDHLPVSSMSGNIPSSACQPGMSFLFRIQKTGVVILEPMINKTRWKYVCRNCPFVPDKVPAFCGSYVRPLQTWRMRWIPDAPDYVQTMRISKRTGELGKRPMNLPDRCNACKAQYRRATRMGKRMDRIHAVAKSYKDGRKIPKLLTFALPSQWFSWDERLTSREDEIRALGKLLPRARTILQENGVEGGSYVLECTYKWTPDLENFTHPKYKFHAHVHMVAIAPYIHYSKLSEWCQQLMPIGLGRINYQAVKNRRKTAVYVSKYLVKDKVQCRTFGIMRKNTHTTP